ncbi:MAG TPA: serine hydrolase domain-containing protein [Chloroflexota bacterium]|nr:serine hydrolase domain-containing protein [Chloroflexota bacterium]
MLNVYALESTVEAAMQAAQVPGLALAIVQRHELMYARGFGTTSVEEGGQPVAPTTLFRVGSVTKPLTGTAIMRLVDAGMLALDRTVKSYIPWFSLSDPAASEQVTLRMLLSHTSGLPHDHRPFGRRDAAALEARIRHEVPRYQLVAAPGTRHAYSNTGIHVLAYLAEVVTGKSYTEVMQELVFEPLEMERTTFDPTVAMTYPLAQSHSLDEDGTLKVEHRYADNAANYASGQAISNVLDLVNFATMHLRQGRFGASTILSPAAVAEMHRPQAGRGDGTAYGLTLVVKEWRGVTRVGHGGAITNFGATFELVPAVGAAVIALYNRLAAGFGLGQIVDQILGELLDQPAA